MLAVHRLSNGSFGRVAALRDTTTGDVAARPTGATIRWQPPAFDAGTVSVSHPDYDDVPPLTITLGMRMADAIDLPDDDARVNPLWAQWLDEGRITEELLADVPEPDEQVLSRAKATKRALLAAWWSAQESAGVTPQGADFALGITASDVALLNGAFTLAQTAVVAQIKTADDTFAIIDRAGVPRLLTLAQMTAVLLAYGDARAQLSASYAQYAAAIEAATTTGELDAITFA
jgi:hypothetical protein